MNNIKLGIIGADTSHSVAFTRLLNDSSHPYHVGGAQVERVFPGGSLEFPLSAQRVAGFVQELTSGHRLKIADSPEEIAAACDGILLLSADGRLHPAQLEAIAAARKPVYVDKPLALSAREAEGMIELAERFAFPLMSGSAVRFDESLKAVLDSISKIAGADIAGPMPLEPTQNDLFWYGIHSAELLFAIMGDGCRDVTAYERKDMLLIVGEWEDGRIGTIRGRLNGMGEFKAAVHHADGCETVIIGSGGKPYYASLLEQVVRFFVTGHAAIPLWETIEILRFLEAANTSRRTRGKVQVK